MKVLLLSGEFPPMQGGVGDYTACLAAALEQLGVSCVIVTGAHRGVPASHNVFPCIPGWRLPDWRVLTRLIETQRPDILHVQYQTAAFGMRPMVNLLPVLARASRLPIPVVTTFHDLRIPYLFPKAGPMRGWANWLLAVGSQVCVATNDEDLERLTTMWRPGRGPWPAALIPIGSNIAVAPPADYDRGELRLRLGTARDEPLIAFFGLLSQSKALETLFDAIAHFPKDSPVRLVMIGGTEGDSDSVNVRYRRQMTDLCHQLGLDDRVTWAGYSSPTEVSALLSASDVCVLLFRDGASFRRGSLLAALAHSLPVVTTLSPSGRCAGAGAAELRDEDNCLLVRPDDPLAVRSAILRILGSDTLRQRLSRGAASLAKHFAWDRIAVKTAALYDSLLTGRGR